LQRQLEKGSGHCSAAFLRFACTDIF